MKKTALILFIVLIFFRSPNFLYADEGTSGVISLSRDAVVAIVRKADDNKYIILGAGFFISETGTIATCDHVIKQVSDVLVMKITELETSKLLGYITTKDKLPQ